jgi:uncharacterized membrane protein YbhN (UPF0104 family)
VLHRVWASRWLRPVLLCVVLAFCGYALAKGWPQVRPALDQLHWYSVVGSIVAAMAGSACGMIAWRSVLSHFGSPLPVAVAARVSFVAQLAKYVPGAVWSFAAHVELGHDYQVPRRRAAASVAVALAVTAGSGLLIAALTLSLASPEIVRKYLLALIAVPVIAICLVPPVLQRLLDAALRLIRQPPLEQPLPWRALGQAFAWSTAGWLIYGVQIWLLFIDVGKDGPRTFLIAVGAYSLAYSLALLLVVFPGGIGPRELLLVAALAPLLAHGPALAVALATRLVTTVSDLAWGGIGVLIGRTERARPDRSPNRGGGRHRRIPDADSSSARTVAEGSQASTGASVPEVAA